MQKVTTFLMFAGNAEEAITLYTSLIRDSGIVSITLYGAGEPGDEGTVKHAVFTLGGQEYMAIDSKGHDFTFTPATSLFVQCESEAEFEDLYRKLSEGGGVLMPPDNYGFSQRFAWVADRFGVSWQLNVP